MVFIGGTDEIIVGGIHLIPDTADLARHAVHISLRGDTGFFGVVFDLLPVLVRPGAEKHIVAAQAPVARHRIGKNHLISVAEVRLAGGIGNGGCQIKFGIHSESPFKVSQRSR